ncbi:alpha/beta-hydrolase [Ascodesmis nigricans]|uniref:Alpha/beta-hydrolase n=1 Tax=Ascodesmis nigricans TaxID=341454 RepID=A0A4S2N7C8_9PEZI|nr:alpha/beta-hydrolase [Ascodesmis nigricans]
MAQSNLQINRATRLGVLGYLSIFGIVFRLGPAIFRALLFGPKDQPLKPRLRNALILHMTSSLSWQQIQATTPPSFDTYSAWTRSKGLEPVATELRGDGTVEKPDVRVMWIGEEWKQADTQSGRKKVLLYCHGGGFVIPMNKEFPPLMDHIKKSYAEKNPGYELSVGLLEYSVTPNKKYPYQLSQAVHALRHLISIGVPPSSIILGGDSCGGHLALSLISHILHPFPGLPPISLSSPLAAVLLISPCLTFFTNSQTFIENTPYDLQTGPFISRYGSLYTENTTYYTDVATGKYYGEPVAALAEWWTGLSNVVKKVGVTAGEKEVFRGDVDKWVDVMKNFKEVKDGKVGLEVVVGKGECHDEPLMDFGLSYGAEKRDTTKFVVNFVAGSV